MIARRLALEGSQTFSGVFPTNGFHPLWLYLLAAYARGLATIDPNLLWRANFGVPLAALVLATATCLLARIERALGIPTAAFVLPPVVFVSVTGVLYSEAHTQLAALAWLGWLIVRIDRGDRISGWLLGCATAALVLARLDALFVAAAVFLWVVGREKTLTRWSLSVLASFSVVLLPYLAANWWFFGGLMPISGWVKSSFPVPTPSGFAGAGLSLSLSDYAVERGVVPIAFAVVVSVWSLRRRIAHPLLLVLTAGAVGQMMYTMLFASWCGWHWYYVLPVCAGSLAWGLALRNVRHAPAIASAQVLILSAALVVGLFYKVGYDNRTAPMRAIQEYLASGELAGRAVFVSELPGEAAFLGKANVIAADMLTANRRWYRRVVGARDPWQALLTECARAGHPLDEVIYVGGAFVAREGDQLVWLDPVVVSRRPLARMDLREPTIRREDVPFIVWRVSAGAHPRR